MPYKIFLSHGKADIDWVNWIKVNAENNGVDVYLFEYDPQPGTYVADKVKQAIQNSDIFVVLLTHESQFSPYVQQEIGFAEANGKRIIPLVQPGIQKQTLAMLEGREYIPFDFCKPSEALLELLSYLQGLKIKKENEQTIILIMAIGGIIGLSLLGGGKK